MPGHVVFWSVELGFVKAVEAVPVGAGSGPVCYGSRRGARQGGFCCVQERYGQVEIIYSKGGKYGIRSIWWLACT